MSRFTIKIAERMVADCGLPCIGRELLPVLRSAETEHDLALAQMEEARDKPLQNERRKRDRQFTDAARKLWAAWQAMDEDSRARLAWSAVYGGKQKNPASKWLMEAVADVTPSAKVPYGVSYKGVERRVEQMIVALGTLPMKTPHLPAKRGAKKQVGGLEAASAVFAAEWEALAGKRWYPTYSLANERGPRRCDNVDARLFLAFAQALAVEPPYSLTNCYSASGGKGDGKSRK